MLTYGLGPRFKREGISVMSIEPMESPLNYKSSSFFVIFNWQFRSKHICGT